MWTRFGNKMRKTQLTETVPQQKISATLCCGRKRACTSENTRRHAERLRQLDAAANRPKSVPRQGSVARWQHSRCVVALLQQRGEGPGQGAERSGLSSGRTWPNEDQAGRELRGQRAGADKCGLGVWSRASAAHARYQIERRPLSDGEQSKIGMWTFFLHRASLGQ
jgi:hypothetical protein